MSSVEAARHAEAALRAVGKSAPSSSHGSRSAGVHQNNASDAFASLFDAARANYGTRPEPSDSRQSSRSEVEGSNPSSSAGKEDADSQASSSDPPSSASSPTSHADTKQAKSPSRQRQSDGRNDRERKAVDRDAPQAAQGNQSCEARKSADQESKPAEAEATEPASTFDAAPLKEPTSGQAQLIPSPTDAANSISLPGLPPASPPQAAVPDSVSSQTQASPVGSVASSGAPSGTATVLPSAIKALPGTQRAEGAEASRQNAAADANSNQESAKAAATGGSFDHVLQTAARTKAQIAGKADPVGNAQEPAEVVKPDEPASLNQLARVLRSSGRDGQSRMLIQLDPPELGKVRIDVRMQEQSLTLRMEAQTQAGHDALASRLTDLKSALEQQGVHVQSMEVEMRPPPGHAPQGQSQQQASNGGTGGFSQPQQQRGADREGGHAGGGNAGHKSGSMAAKIEDAATPSVSPWSSRGLNLVA